MSGDANRGTTDRSPADRGTVLVIAPTPFFADRGCHVRIYEEVRLLEDLGYHVEVCTYHHGRDLPGVRTRRTLNVPWYRKLAPGPSYHKFYVDLFLLVMCAWAILRLRPRFLHTFLHEGALVGSLLGRLFRVPCVSDLQGSLTKELADYDFARGNRLVYRLLERVEGWIDRLPDHLIVSSEVLQEDLVGRFGIPRERITQVRDGVGISFFERPEPAPRADYGIAPGQKIVVFLGVLTRLQGVEILKEAMPQVLDERDDVTFVVIGFPGEKEFAAHMQELGYGDRVVFPGRIDYLKVARTLAMADLAISPKISKTEGNGKLYDYMAAGLPTVVFESEVNREILGDLGIYVRGRTGRAFARGILGALQEPEAGLGERLAEKAQRECSWRLNREIVQGIYEPGAAGAPERSGRWAPRRAAQRRRSSEETERG